MGFLLSSFSVLLFIFTDVVRNHRDLLKFHTADGGTLYIINICMYMYVYVCICMYMYVYVCICMYMYVYVYMLVAGLALQWNDWGVKSVRANSAFHPSGVGT